MRQFIKYYIKDSILLGLENIKLVLFTKKKPILVFTMAKVGSLSVYFSLKKKLSKNAIFHVHSLNEIEVKKGIQLCFQNKVYPGSKTPVFLINKKIINQKRPFKIVCLFRDPLERNISAFFDAFKLYTGKESSDYKGSLKKLKEYYDEKLNHEFPLNWFDNQFFDATNINIYDHKFDKQQGYSILKTNAIELLLINSNVSDSIKEVLIKDFCNLKSFKLKNRNLSSSKEYALLNSNFKKQTKFSKEYLDLLYHSKYASHFFTDSYIEKQIEKWRKF
ncbi:MAG: putative capsular polysaccharide synthesis family protein [Flavobacteriaceae bacterium]|nr:putative capsular polysaccharide synthesis family protein [Flavobacteriaceae bacterium]